MSQNLRDPLIGTRLGDYVLQSLIGRGGMARVYRGLDEGLSRLAAVKVLEIHADDVDEVMIKRFQLEARAIARFDHPNIVSVYQSQKVDNLFFIAMKLIEGETLTQLLRQASQENKLLPPERIVQITRDVCSALDYAHQRGIIHRDVKPSNVLFDAEGRAILTDFGLALETEGGTTLGTAFGTPRYISPEQAVSSQKAVPQSDIYSLGVVVFEMVTGRVPFHDESPMSIALYHITNPPPRPRSLNPNVPIQVEDAILKALEKAPENRYQTAGEFAEALYAAYCAAGIDLRLPPTATQPLSPVSPTPPSAEKSTNGGAAAVAAPAPRPEKAKKVKEPKPRKEPKKERATTPGMPVVRPANRRGLRIVLLLLAVIAVVALLAVLAPRLPNLVPGGGGGGPVVVSGGASVLTADAGLTFTLNYDDNGFVLRNPNDAPLALGGLTFTRGEGDGAVTFDAMRFVGPIPPGQCAWVRRLDDVDRRRPSGCPDPIFHLTMLPEDEALFWAVGEGAESFVVKADGQELATCPLGQNTCVFTVPG